MVPTDAFEPVEVFDIAVMMMPMLCATVGLPVFTPSCLRGFPGRFTPHREAPRGTDMLSPSMAHHRATIPHSSTACQVFVWW